ncbi:MAG TPA: DUF305 domain-containing protein [Rubricoccaceae bacterium]|jgi:uncharacterized protein (DUF305 family)
MRALLVALATGLAACQSPSETAPVPAAPDHAAGAHGAAAHDAPSVYTDARFLDDMTAHHEMAVEMAREAQTRAQRPDVQALAATMLRDQQGEIQEMATIRRTLPAAASSAPHGPDEMARMGMAMPMDSLTSAADFDRAFLEMMVPHHAGAVVMAAEAQARSARPDVRALARRIVEAQAREIGEMQQALTAAVDSAAGPVGGAPRRAPRGTAPASGA